MILVGAGAHALELLSVYLQVKPAADLAMFDDVTPNLPPLFRGRFPILRSMAEARAWLTRAPDFCVAVGKPALRRRLFEQFVEAGGKPVSVIANTAIVGNSQATVRPSDNLMHQVFPATTTEWYVFYHTQMLF